MTSPFSLSGITTILQNWQNEGKLLKWYISRSSMAQVYAHGGGIATRTVQWCYI